MLEAALFGAVAQSALLVGALLVWKFPHLKKPKYVGGLMAFGAGAVISAVTIDLVSVSYDEAGAGPTAIGIGIGCLIYFGIIALLERKGHDTQPAEVIESEMLAAEAGTEPGAGTAAPAPATHDGEVHGATKQEARNMTIGMVIDGVPESVAIGLTLHTATVGVSAALVVQVSPWSLDRENNPILRSWNFSPRWSTELV